MLTVLFGSGVEELFVNDILSNFTLTNGQLNFTSPDVRSTGYVRLRVVYRVNGQLFNATRSDMLYYEDLALIAGCDTAGKWFDSAAQVCVNPCPGKISRMRSMLSWLLFCP